MYKGWRYSCAVLAVIMIEGLIGEADGSCEQQVTAIADSKGDFVISGSHPRRDCSVVFFNENRLSLKITIQFFNNSENQCHLSYLSTYSIPEIHDHRFPRLIDKFCDKPEHPLIITQIPQIAVILTSRLDSNSIVRGSFQFTNNKLIDTYRHSTERCGEQFLEDSHGEIIVKPNQQAMRCLWLITSGSSHSLLVTVDELSIGNTETCVTEEYLGLYDGPPDLARPPDRQFCGKTRHHSPWRRQLISSGSSVGISYNRLKSGASFLLRWNHIYKPIAMQKTKVGCSSKKFYCEGGRYCLDKDESLCRFTEPFCIDSELLCNHHANCGLIDASDEYKCDYENRRVTIVCAVLGGLVTLVIICVICWQRNRMVREIHRVARQTSLRRGRRTALVPDRSELLIRNVLPRPQTREQSAENNHLDIPSTAQRKISLPAYLHSEGDNPSRRKSSAALMGNRRVRERRSTQIQFNHLPMMHFSSSAYR